MVGSLFTDKSSNSIANSTCGSTKERKASKDFHFFRKFEKLSVI